MKRFHYALITAAFAALLLSACGSADTDTAGSSGDNFLVVLNYGKYLDSSAIKMFEQETGIKIKLEEYESPEEMYTKFSAGSISYDVVRTSDYMVERLIHEGKVAPIDFSSFSYYKNLDPAILAAAEVFDPQNQYSMPYFYGTLGILYNTTMVSEEEHRELEHPVGRPLPRYHYHAELRPGFLCPGAPSSGPRHQHGGRDRSA